MTPEQALLSGVAKTVFRLNGQLLALADRLAAPAGLTAACWQVLGVVLSEPLPVAAIARRVGVTRQSVQRVADLLVDQGLAEYLPNPAHRRAKLLRPTSDGRNAIRQIAPHHAAFAKQLGDEVGTDQMRRVLEDLTRLSQALNVLDPSLSS